MLIVVAGIKRSGSTAQFNMVRIALETAGYKVNIHGQNYKLTGGVDLVKIHPFDKELADNADYIFLTDRDNTGIKASLYRFNGAMPTDDRISRLRANLDMWKEYKHCMCEFDLLKESPLECVKKVTGALPFDVDAKYVYEEFEKVKPPKSGHDRTTLLFHNHITYDHS